MIKMSKYAIVDYRLDKNAVKSLEQHFDKVVPSVKLDVNPSICGHPDLSVCKIDEDKITVCPSAYEYYKNELPDIKIICGSSEPFGKYPKDIFYNAACGNHIAVHNFKFTDKITLAQIEQKFSKHINVQQGYSKCSISFTGNNGMITDDDGIYENLIIHGFDALKIKRGKIILSGMNYGFFGGATGYSENKLFLNGEIKYLDDAEIIIDYLKKHDTELIEVNKGFVVDIGTIVCLSGKI